MKNIRSRKGVTVMEVVIALVIITAISAVSLSMIVISHDVEAKAESAITAKNAAENAVECYRFAKSYAQEVISNSVTPIPIATLFPQMFFEYLGKTGDYRVGTMVDGVFTESQSDPLLMAAVEVNASSAFRLVANGCTITVTQQYDAGELIGITFVAERGGEEIYHFTYPEGGASQ